MGLDHDLAREYFAPSTPLWNWTDEGEVVAWSGGSTIAFRAEIGAILSRLETTGLPRFGAIVLLIGAYRENWNDASGGREALEKLLSYFPGPNESYLLFADVLQGLDRVHESRDLLVTPAAKAELAAFVFEATKYRWTAEPTAAVMRAFQNGLSASELVLQESESKDGILADAADLRPGLAGLNRASLELRLRTGLERGLEPAPIDLPPGVGARRLIQQFADDQELGGVARLARLLLAAVQLPRPLHEPEELPIGGVSDIANRGPLDRLILSELANDDLTLAVRVAMREALYLRREPLARTIPRRRLVLIDSGLRMWGVPRVFAAAVGLAVAAQADKNVSVSAWRAAGDQIIPVDFSRAEGITAHLGELDHRAHPGAALPAFVKTILAESMTSDAILITGEDVLADWEFCQQLNAAHLESLYIAVVQRNGAFRMLHRTLRGTKALRTAQFAIEEVLAPPARATPSLNNSSVITSLPAIYGLDPFPLRLSLPVRLENSWRITPWGCLVTLSNDGRLFRWDGPQFGAEQIAEALPGKQIQYCSPDTADGTVTMVVGKLSQNGLYAIRIKANTGIASIRHLRLTMNQPQSVVMHNGVILVISAKDVNAFDPASGALLDVHSNPHPVSRWGRYVPLYSTRIGCDRWVAISFDGSAIQFVELDRSSVTAPPLLAVFDVTSVPNGPVGITATGELVFLGDDRRVSISGLTKAASRAFLPCEVRAISRDGSQVVLSSPTAHQVLVHVATQRADQPIFGDARVIANPLTTGMAQPREVRRKHRAISVDRFDRLLLFSRKWNAWPITFDANRNLIVIPQSPAAPSPKDLTPSEKHILFESIDESSTGGRTLSAARWPDGSIAVLDHLGMLHLRSSDRGIPECSIVLQEGTTSGWVADGRFWGEPYYIGTQPATPAITIWEEVLRPFMHRITQASTSSKPQPTA